MSRPRGRPPVYTVEKGLRFLDLYRSGSSVRSAAQQVGVTDGTVYRWRKRHSEFGAEFDLARMLYLKETRDRGATHSFRLGHELMDEVRQRATRYGITITDAVRAALKEWLEDCNG